MESSLETECSFICSPHYTRPRTNELGNYKVTNPCHPPQSVLERWSCVVKLGSSLCFVRISAVGFTVTVDRTVSKDQTNVFISPEVESCKHDRSFTCRGICDIKKHVLLLLLLLLLLWSLFSSSFSSSWFLLSSSPADQPTEGPKGQTTRGRQDQRTIGVNQRTKKTEDRRTRDRRTKAPEDTKIAKKNKNKKYIYRYQCRTKCPPILTRLPSAAIIPSCQRCQLLFDLL